MEEKSKKATQEGAELAQAAREYANKVWLNFDKEYEKLSMSNKECGKLLPKDLLIWEVIHKAYEKGAEWADEHPQSPQLSAADRGIIDEIIFALSSLSKEKMISYHKEIEFLNKIRKL